MRGRWTLIGLAGAVWILLFSLPEGLAKERYLVKPGDTLYKISKSCSVSVDTLRRVNALETDAIKPKQVLLIPRDKERQGEAKRRLPAHPATGGTLRVPVKSPSGEVETYAVKKGDTLFSIAKSAGSSIDEIRKANHLRSSSLRVGQKLIVPKQPPPLQTAKTEEEAEESGDGEVVNGASLLDIDRQADSEALNKWGSVEERTLLVRVVKTFLGAPYRLGGSTIKGIDCSAFVRKIYEIFNIRLPRTVREQLSFGKKVEKDQLEEGDLVFFITRRGNNGHVGIYIGNNEFVHASTRTKEVKVDSLNAPYFHQRFFKAIRVKELEKEVRL